jgi:hypothetical protein
MIVCRCQAPASPPCLLNANCKECSTSCLRTCKPAAPRPLVCQILGHSECWMHPGHAWRRSSRLTARKIYILYQVRLQPADDAV